MATQSQIETLIHLAQLETDACAKRLGLATNAVKDAEQKLTMLFGYRDDYAQKLNLRGQAGMSPSAYQNFMAFMNKLDNAIHGQQDVVNMSQRRMEQERKAWQESERKRMSYGALQKRDEARKLKIEAKRDQRAMDEHANRLFFYKR